MLGSPARGNGQLRKEKRKERCKRLFWWYDLCLIAVATVLEGQSGAVGTVPEGHSDDGIAFRHCKKWLFTVEASIKGSEMLKFELRKGSASSIPHQRSELRAGVNIVVATPERFIDHLQQVNTSLSQLSYVVLDEAGRILDMGFEPQIKEVMRNLPEKHQTLLFSATMPVEIESLAQEYLTDPVRVKVGKMGSPTANVAQFLVKVSDNEKVCLGR